MHSVPIVVVTCDRFKDKVEQFRYQYAIHSIISIKNNFQFPNKIIVVDNGSSDLMINTLKIWEQNKIIYKLIQNKENTGIATPKNQGIKAIDFDYKYVIYVKKLEKLLFFTIIRREPAIRQLFFYKPKL